MAELSLLRCAKFLVDDLDRKVFGFLNGVPVSSSQLQARLPPASQMPSPAGRSTAWDDGETRQDDSPCWAAPGRVDVRGACSDDSEQGGDEAESAVSESDLR